MDTGFLGECNINFKWSGVKMIEIWKRMGLSAQEILFWKKTGVCSRALGQTAFVQWGLEGFDSDAKHADIYSMDWLKKYPKNLYSWCYGSWNKEESFTNELTNETKILHSQLGKFWFLEGVVELETYSPYYDNSESKYVINSDYNDFGNRVTLIESQFQFIGVVKKKLTSCREHSYCR